MRDSTRQITTIKISKKIVAELSNLKIHPRQSYEEVVVKLLEYSQGNVIVKPFTEPRQITTIKLSKNTVEELSKLKIHPRQSYEEVIVQLLENYKAKNED
jgi:hypothetical protein